MAGRRLRTAALLLGIVLVVAVAVSAWAGARRVPPDGRREAAMSLLSAVHVASTVTGSALGVTSADADFGLEAGVRMVRVRIVEELRLEVRIDAERDVVVLGSPRGCLVGPFSNPIDAGLSDPCWGDPDVGMLLAVQLPTDGAGHPLFRAGQSMSIDVTVRRGVARCDYPPGAWHLKIAADPLVDGAPVSGLEMANIALEVPAELAGDPVVRPFDATRFCSYAHAVYISQGEPP